MNQQENSEAPRFVISDLTSEIHWEQEPTTEEHHWLAEIADLSPEPFLLQSHLQMDHPPAVEPILTRDIDGWRANRYIGEIHHRGKILDIKPRLGIEPITQWISTILNVQVLPQTASSSHRSANPVTQLLAALWRASVITAGQHSLPRRRQKVRSDGYAVRGRLDIAATARHRATGRQDLVSVHVTRSYDNAPARAVVLADRYFSQVFAGTSWRGKRLEEQMTRLRNATGTRPVMPTLEEIRRARYSPITLKWRRAAELSWRILAQNPLGAAADSDSAHGILFDVAELWELFVIHCVGLATPLPVRHGSTAEASGYLGRSLTEPERKIGRLYPDALVGEDPVHAIIDAKYKRLGPRRGVDREDLYQLHAYSSSFNAPQAALAYPLTHDPASPQERYGPWETMNSELSFLRLPTDREGCIEQLRAWLDHETKLQTPSLEEDIQNY